MSRVLLIEHCILLSDGVRWLGRGWKGWTLLLLGRWCLVLGVGLWLGYWMDSVFLVRFTSVMMSCVCKDTYELCAGDADVLFVLCSCTPDHCMASFD